MFGWRRVTRFYMPLLIQAFSQSLTYPLVAGALLLAAVLFLPNSAHAYSQQNDSAFWTAWNTRITFSDSLAWWVRNEYWTRDHASELESDYLRSWLAYRPLAWLEFQPGLQVLESRTAHGAPEDYFRYRGDAFCVMVLRHQVGNWRLSLYERYAYGRYMTRGRTPSGHGRAVRMDDRNNHEFRTGARVLYSLGPEIPVSPYVMDWFYYREQPVQNLAYAGFLWDVTKMHQLKVFYCRRSRFHPSGRNMNTLGLEYTFLF